MEASSCPVSSGLGNEEIEVDDPLAPYGAFGEDVVLRVIRIW